MDTGGGCEVCVEGCVLCGGWRRRRREESPSYESERRGSAFGSDCGVGSGCPPFRH